jgi:hypothetical protein
VRRLDDKAIVRPATLSEWRVEGESSGGWLHCMLHDDKVHVLYMHLVVCTIAYSYSDCACVRACVFLTD